MLELLVINGERISTQIHSSLKKTLKSGSSTIKLTLMIDSNSKDLVTSLLMKNLTQRKVNSNSIELLSLKLQNQKEIET
jgi:hypothetical protein